MTEADFILLTSQRIVEIMKFKKLSPLEISSISGISKAQIYRILSGNCNTTIKTIYRLLSSLNISLNAFFNFTLSVKSLTDINIASPLSEELKSIAENFRIQQSKMSRLKKLTQAKIAEMLGQADYKYVGYVLNGRQNSYINLKLSTLYNLSKLLGLDNELYKLFKTN